MICHNSLVTGVLNFRVNAAFIMESLDFRTRVSTIIKVELRCVAD